MQSSILSAHFTLIVFLNSTQERLFKNEWTLLITSLFSANKQPQRYFLWVGIVQSVLHDFKNAPSSEEIEKLNEEISFDTAYSALQTSLSFF